MKTKIIGISGKKYSGKDTLFSVIKELLGDNAMRIAFADSLKDEVYNAVLKPEGIGREALDDERKKYFRLILQGWGGEFRRQFNSDQYWLEQAKKKVKDLQTAQYTGVVVITDVRYKNEAQWIHDMGGTLIRINRPRKGLMGKIKDLLGIVPDKHTSETDLDNCPLFDYVVNNSGTIRDLKPKAEEILKESGF